MAVTAGFTRDEYTLTVSNVGSGTVMRDPDQTTYWHNTIVELTAMPAVGWSFSGWSGALAGSENPASLTMDGDKSVTANFEYQPVENPMPIGGVEIEVGDTLPAHVEVRIDGYLPDACTRVSSVEQERVGNSVEVQVLTTRPPNRTCAQ